MHNIRARPTVRCSAPTARRVQSRGAVSHAGWVFGENRDQRALAEHALWCREERENLLTEIAKCDARTGGVREPDDVAVGGLLSRTLLRARVEQLERVIAACDLHEKPHNTGTCFDRDGPKEIQ